ncbi:MAG: hypothetical protein R2789_00055 [Microthrixaceae bacterium]
MPSPTGRCFATRVAARVQLFGSTKGVERRFFAIEDDPASGGGDLEYDNLFIFDEVGWNFEPSELSGVRSRAARQADHNLARRQRSYELTRFHFASPHDLFVLPRLTEGVETGWHMFPVIIRPDSGIRRAGFQQWMESHGIDTRMVDRQRRPPAAFRDEPHRTPADGLPNADRGWRGVAAQQPFDVR